MSLGNDLISRKRRISWGNLLAGLLALALGCALGLAMGSAFQPLLSALVGMAILLSLSLLTPPIGLFAWILVSPFARYLNLNISLGAGVPDLNLDRVAAFFLVAVLFGQWLGKKHIRWGKVEMAMLAFLGGTLLSVPASIESPVRAVQEIFDSYFLSFLVFFLAKNLLTRRGHLETGIYSLELIGLYLSILVILEQVVGYVLFHPLGRSVVYTPRLRRAVTLLGNPAFTSGVLGMALPFILYSFVREKRPSVKFLHALLLVASVIALVVLYNRTGWLCGLFALVAMGLLHPPSRKFLVPAAVVAALLVAIFWSYIITSPAITERLRSGEPIRYRLTTLKVGLAMAARHPLLGIGYENFGSEVIKEPQWEPFPGMEVTPHNSFLQVLISSGLIGFIPYVAIFLLIAYEGWTLWRDRRRAIYRGLLAAFWAAFGVYILSSFTIDILYAPFNSKVFFLLAGMTMALKRESFDASGNDGPLSA